MLQTRLLLLEAPQLLYAYMDQDNDFLRINNRVKAYTNQPRKEIAGYRRAAFAANERPSPENMPTIYALLVDGGQNFAGYGLRSHTRSFSYGLTSRDLPVYGNEYEALMAYMRSSDAAGANPWNSWDMEEIDIVPYGFRQFIDAAAVPALHVNEWGLALRSFANGLWHDKSLSSRDPEYKKLVLPLLDRDFLKSLTPEQQKEYFLKIRQVVQRNPDKYNRLDVALFSTDQTGIGISGPNKKFRRQILAKRGIQYKPTSETLIKSALTRAKQCLHATF
jgi:hypothetical protein